MYNIFNQHISIVLFGVHTTYLQLDAVRQLCSSKRGEKEVLIENNFRPINPIGKRMVKKPVENPDDY